MTKYDKECILFATMMYYKGLISHDNFLARLKEVYSK